VDRRTLFAVGSFVVSAVLTAIGTFSGSDDNQVWQWLVVLAITAVVVVALFWVIVPRLVGGTGGAALVVAVVSVVALAVFWAGLPVPIAAAAAYLGLDARDRPGANPLYVNGAFAIAAIVVALAVLAAFAA
jgi:uncharacterized membrane protein